MNHPSTTAPCTHCGQPDFVSFLEVTGGFCIHCNAEIKKQLREQLTQLPSAIHLQLSRQIAEEHGVEPAEP